MTHSEPGDFATLGDMIRAIRVALLTTVQESGQFHTRPVETLAVEPSGVLWFFTDTASHKAEEVRRDMHVSLGYADPRRHTYAAVSGIAGVFRDPVRARELWTVEQRAYYPEGAEDPRLALLRVQIERAEYWIAPGRVSYLLAAARAALTGTPAGVIGENRKLPAD